MDYGFWGIQKCKNDTQCHFVSISSDFLEATGFRHEDITIKYKNSFFAMLGDEEAQRVKKERLRQRTHSNESTVCYPFQTKEGEKRWVLEHSTFFTEDDTEYLLMKLFCMDVVLEERGFYRYILQLLLSPVLVLDKNLCVVYLNPAAEKIYDTTLEQCKGKPCSDFGSEYCGTEDCSLQRYLRGEKPFLRTHKNGSVCRIHGSQMYDTSGQVIGYIGYFVEVTELIEMQRMLQKSEERCRVALRQTCSEVLEYDLDSQMVSKINFETGAMEKSFRLDLEEGDFSKVEIYEQLCIHESSWYDMAQMYRQIQNGSKSAEAVLRAKHPAGNWHWIKVMYNTIFDDKNQPMKAVGISQDITAERTTMENFQKELQYRHSISSETMGSFEIDLTQDKILWLNDRMWSEEIIAKGASYTELLELATTQAIHPDDAYGAKITMDRENLLAEFQRGKKEVHYEYRRKNSVGRMVWVLNSIYLIREACSGHICGFSTIKDIDTQKRKQQELQIQAERDPLTGLYNRMTILSMIEKNLKIETGVKAIAMLDIDHFKQVNDMYGHLYGDAVLSELARKMSMACRTEQLAGRIGGDEFILFFSMPTKELVLQKAQSICELLHMQFSSGGTQCEITISMGITFVTEEAQSFEVLYEKADVALYRAKELGRNRYCVYEEDGVQHSRKQKRKPKQMEENIGKTFTENVEEYIFKILYHAEDITNAIPLVLELICRRYNAQHGYLYEYRAEEDNFTLRFEGRNEEEEGHWLKESTIALGQAECKELFREAMVLVMDEKSEYMWAFEETRENTKGKWMVVTGMKHNGEFTGLIGLSYNNLGGGLTGRERTNLQTVGEILGIFLQLR